MSGSSLQLVDARDDRRILAWALAAATALHVVFVFVDLPERRTLAPRPTDEPPRISAYEIPPPPPEEPRRELPAAAPEASRVLYVPDDTDRTHEPLTEEHAMNDVDVAALSFEALIEIGNPQPPEQPDHPLIPGIDGITAPVLILDTKVPPVYPELARVARREGRVILEAVVRRDGTVGETRVLQCNSPGLGFEEAAIEAIGRWVYEPATQHGRPVDVYFTVVVEFTLK